MGKIEGELAVSTGPLSKGFYVLVNCQEATFKLASPSPPLPLSEGEEVQFWTDRLKHKAGLQKDMQRLPETVRTGRCRNVVFWRNPSGCREAGHLGMESPFPQSPLYP